MMYISGISVSRYTYLHMNYIGERSFFRLIIFLGVICTEKSSSFSLQIWIFDVFPTSNQEAFESVRPGTFASLVPRPSPTTFSFNVDSAHGRKRFTTETRGERLVCAFVADFWRPISAARNRITRVRKREKYNVTKTPTSNTVRRNKHERSGERPNFDVRSAPGVGWREEKR